MTLSGIAPAAACSDNGNELGIEKVDKYYEENKLTERERPLTVTLGASTSFTAYLSGIQMDVADPQNRIYQFDMSLELPPRFKKK
jgi:ABC-type oligopeptide transport system substrate-binding subunit